MKQLFESYNISENTEKLEQVSECVSQIPEEETTRVSDDDVHSSCTTSTGNLKPKCLNNTDSSKFSPERKPSKKETCEKGNPGSRVRGSLSKSSGNGRSGIDSGSRGSVRRPEKPRKEESNNREKGKIRKQGKKSHVKQCKSAALSLFIRTFWFSSVSLNLKHLWFLAFSSIFNLLLFCAFFFYFGPKFMVSFFLDWAGFSKLYFSLVHF